MEPNNPNQNIPQYPPQNSGLHNKNVRLIVSVVFVVALVILGALLWNNLMRPKAPPVTGEPAPGVELTRTGTVVPEGFLESIPLEIDNIIDAQKAEYVDNGVTQYTITYSTASSTNEKYSQYYRYFAENGFYTSGEGSNREEGRIFSTRGDEEVLVFIALDNDVQTVTVNYIQRSI